MQYAIFAFIEKKLKSLEEYMQLMEVYELLNLGTNIAKNYLARPTVQEVYSCKYGRSLLWLLFKQSI